MTQPQTIQKSVDEAHALEITNLVVSYGAKRAVDGIDLAVRQGEIFGLLGPNGADKTSTLSAVEGLPRPAAGAILIGGIDIRTEPVAAKAGLGVQLQATSFQAELTTSQIVNLYARLYGVVLSKDEIRRQLAAIGLEGDATRTLPT
jgi:ABC-2 type transport system ATP-binding protein